MEADIYLTRTESESDTNSLFRDSLSAEDSPQIHPIDPADDINLDELDLAAEADGGDSTGSTLLKSKIAARLKGWKSLVEDFLYDAIDIRSTLKTSPNHLASDKQLAVLLTFINTVRRGRASLRYPLDMRSSEFTHIRHKPSVIRVLTAIAWHGKEFEPSQFPEQLIRQTHDDYITYKVSHSSGTDHKKGSGPVVFSHYTRWVLQSLLLSTAWVVQALTLSLQKDVLHCVQ